MSTILYWVMARFKEPSTWAGLAGLSLALGISTELWTGISGAGAAIAGLMAILLKDKAS